MNTTILLDLQEQVRALPAVGKPIERVELMYAVGYWIVALKEPLEMEFWLARFAAELEAKHVDIHPSVCRAYLHFYVNAARNQVFS